MPFNSNSYYRNKYRRQAGEYLAAARSDPASATFNVRMARSTWRQYLAFRRMCECDADLKLRMRGQMSHADFMGKWGTK